QDKSIRTVKSISNNVLEVEVYYYSFNLLYKTKLKKSFHYKTHIIKVFKHLIICVFSYFKDFYPPIIQS
ncbi:hypothetical protein AZJ93_04495, partial [Streptococcus pneumoniae]